MKLAFCLFKYFPYGGLQRDFMRIARECHSRGHEIHVYTMNWEGDTEPSFHLHLIEAVGLQNHTRSANFAKKVKVQLDIEQFDVVVGFNKMPYLDLYYAADVCYQARVKEQRSFLYRLMPRYRQWVKLEEQVFSSANKTKVMLISALQQTEYTKCYHTEAARFHLLPPGIAKDRIAPSHANEIRARVRLEHHLPEDHILLLMVGSGFKTKGLDRAIIALAALPAAIQQRCHLFVVGQDRPNRFLALASQKKVKDRVHFLGGRPDVADFMLAADILVHPAYHENTGTVLLEAMVSGLPVLTVDVCGYAHYVSEANAGVVLSSPFHQGALNAALEKMILSPDHQMRRENGLAFARQADIYSMPLKAAELIEKSGRKHDVISAS